MVELAYLFIMKIQDGGGRHIEFRKMTISPGRLRATTARRLSAYMYRER